MRKDSITMRAFRRYYSYNPKYFPLKFLQIVFENFSPYFTLWMSSEIVTALYENGSKESIYTLIARPSWINYTKPTQNPTNPTRRKLVKDLKNWKNSSAIFL